LIAPAGGPVPDPKRNPTRTDSIEVRLDPQDIKFADWVEEERHKIFSHPGRMGIKKEFQREAHHIGARCEVALNKWMNIYYNGTIGVFDRGDCGNWFESRGSKHFHMCLRLDPLRNPEKEPGDWPNKIYVAICLKRPDLALLLGWCWGSFVQDHPELFSKKGLDRDFPSWWIPQDLLESPELLEQFRHVPRLPGMDKDP